MQDFPAPEELLEAVAAYLAVELRPQVPKEERFRVLVAANVCAVVAREIRSGGDADAADLAAFGGLLGESEPSDSKGAAAELAGRIRAGEMDGSLLQVIDDLRDVARRKLEIARPGYADAA